jgi:hypothetical protein
MLAVRTVLLILAVVFFAMSALEIKAPKLDFTAAGLLLVTVALLVSR